MIDAVTGISGSGPAYMYLIIGETFRRNTQELRFDYLEGQFHDKVMRKIPPNLRKI